ncbi:MAG: hypothetical protein ABIO57_02830 [Candidatus Paceibacterota bacterium]
MKKSVLVVIAILIIAFTETASAQKQTVSWPDNDTIDVVAPGITPTGQNFKMGFYFGKKDSRLTRNGTYALIIGWDKAVIDGMNFPSDSLGTATVTVKEGDHQLATSSMLKIGRPLKGGLPPVFLDLNAPQKILTIEVTFKNPVYEVEKMTVVTQQFVVNFDKKKLEAHDPFRAVDQQIAKGK